MWRANIKNRSFNRMGEEFAPLIDPNHFLGRSAFDVPGPNAKKVPLAKAVRKEGLFLLKIMVPGYAKENLSVVIKNDLLFVKGSKESKSAGDAEYVAHELKRESFERLFKLAPSIAREGVEARFENGVLQIFFVDVPKEEETTYREVTID